MNSYRYTKPATNRRPYKSHLYTVKGPKIDRQIKFFHELPLKQWILLEADSDVKAYCERPIEINHENTINKIVDFWVKRENREELILILKSNKNENELDILRNSPFETWANAQNMEIKVKTSEDILSRPVYLKNWQTILHYLSSNRELVSESLISNIVTQFQPRPNITLQSIMDSNSNEDPMLVNTAIFTLLHRGTLQAPDLTKNILSPSTQFMYS